MTSEALSVLNMVVPLLGLTILGSVVGFAWFKGDMGERLGAIVYAGAWMIALGAEWYTGESLPVVPILILDTLIATAFLLLAIRYNNLWLGAAMMLQGIQLGMHAISFTSAPDIHVLGFNVFALTLNLISLFILVTIAGGVAATAKQRRRSRQSQPLGLARA